VDLYILLSFGNEVLILYFDIHSGLNNLFSSDV